VNLSSIITRIVAAVAIGTGGFCVQTAWAVSTDRGVWSFDLNHPVGSGTIVGNALTENAVISVFNRYGLARVYDSFANPVPPPSAGDIAAWHAKLNANGVTPMLLLSDIGTAFSPSFFQSQLIDFNNGRPANEQYAGVNLDIEPHADAASWNGGDLSLAASIIRRDMLWDLAQTFTDIRAQLDANGESATPIYADIPVWYDVLSGFIGWGQGGTGLTAAQERDNFFSAINVPLAGITLMAFGTSNVNVIKSNVAWEISNFSGDIRIALEASIGGGKTWTDRNAFFAAADEIESFYSGTGNSIGIDIQELTQFFTAVQPEPITAVLSFMGLGTLWASVRRRRWDET